MEAGLRDPAKAIEASESLQAFKRLRTELKDVPPDEWQAVARKSVKEGVYAVRLMRLGHKVSEPLAFEVPWSREGLPLVISVDAGVPLTVADELIKRVEHVGLETIIEGVSLNEAVAVKTDLERWGATAKIKEGVRPRSSFGEPIPERVRREVWRRDSERCVDCGSRERLEFDHIIPVKEGGSNTARNIELRCESCNRRKAARI